MSANNYMQRMGPSSCVRCDFETSDETPFEEQDAAIHAHLEEEHPDWMTDGGASVLKHRLAGWQSSPMYQVGDTVQPFGVVAETSKVGGAIDALGVQWSVGIDVAAEGSDRTGYTVHEIGCTCGFCKMGSTKV